MIFWNNSINVYFIQGFLVPNVSFTESVLGFFSTVLFSPINIHFMTPLFITKFLSFSQDKQGRTGYVIGCLPNLTKAAANHITESSLFVLMKRGITKQTVAGKMASWNKNYAIGQRSRIKWYLTMLVWFLCDSYDYYFIMSCLFISY